MHKKVSFMTKYHNILKLSSYAFHFKATFFSTILCGVANQTFSLLTLLLGALLIGKAFAGTASEKILSYFPILFLLCLLQGLFTYLHMLVTHILAYKVLEAMRRDVYDAVERGTPLTTLHYQSGNLNAIIMEDVETLEIFFAHVMGDYVIAFISTFVFFGIFAQFSLPYACLSLLCAVLIAIVPYTFPKIKGEIGQKLRRGRGQNNAFALDVIQGLREILIFNREAKYINRLEKDTLGLNKLEMKDGFYQGLQNTLINLLVSGFALSFVLLAHHLSMTGSLSPEYLSVFIVMVLNIFIPVLSVSGTAASLNSVAASADRVDRILQEESPLQETNPQLPRLKRDTIFSLRDIYFSYKKEDPVLQGISLDIDAGENVALVGASGAGKSTLVKLLLRFYDVDRGVIYFKGADLKSMEPEVLRESIAIVPQDCTLFRGSLLDNLRLGKPDASLMEVKKAADLAVASDFIEALPKQYDSEIGEGGLSFSGGERQRLAITRALVKNSPVLIMDEAVSNLDAENEKNFHQALRQMKQGRTILTVAHRLSTILEADRVIELANGKIIFDGKTQDWQSYRAKKVAALL
ncbi:ABC transporter ATP-binding protein [Mageeibacillus indolicus]|uniref:ABC transporter ATP-binding protein n=1 Tax=Mageeibacillus indolicus TaxID=884684 RepID=A0A2J8B3Q3_9FIRM|nr:ABC transporter ATP-binding protein [Mageeibacillus indolicus]PNH19409.1 ABC transporter ATP-binding protein [Mageeibacillus indolicus]